MDDDAISATRMTCSGWTADVTLVVLDNGMLLTPWGRFEVGTIDMIKASYQGETLVGARLTLGLADDSSDVVILS